MQGWTLPTTVTVGGKPYAVHTDYRDILDIIKHLLVLKFNKIFLNALKV